MSARWLICCALLILTSLAEGFDVGYSVAYRDRTDRIENVDAISETIARAYDPGRRVGILGIGVLGLLCLCSRRRRRVRVRGALGWCILVLLAWACISPLWADDIGLASRRVVVLMLLALGALGVGSVLEPRDVNLFALTGGGLVLLVGIGAELVLGTFQPLSPEYRLGGVMHPIGLAQVCGMVLMAAVALAAYDEKWRLQKGLPGVLAFAALILTRSRGPLAAAVGGCALSIGAVSSRLKQSIFVLSVAAVTCLALLLGVQSGTDLSQVVLLGRGDSEMLTLTGRLPVWREAARYLADRPLLGYGYGAFWVPGRFEEFASATGFHVADVHNSYLDVAMGLGIPGGILTLLVAALLVATALRRLSAGRTSAAAAFTFAFAFAFSFNMLLLTVFGQPELPSVVWMILAGQLAFSGSGAGGDENADDSRGGTVRLRTGRAHSGAGQAPARRAGESIRAGAPLAITGA